MPKYLVTSGSHFTPFTYDELVKPVAHMQAAHDAAQDAYDTLNLETSALRNYISDNPDDSRAKAMYDNYMDKLTTLQNNLWEHGYNGQTRRDLSAARSAYASDITRLGKAIQTRQERSKAYWDMRHKNPDLIMGEDPGIAGLNYYLDDDNYGQDYFSYSGQQFMSEVGADAKARAGEMLRDPQVLKNPDLVGYLTTIQQDGFTNQEVQNAGNAVRAAVAGNGAALDALDPASRILADVLMSHLNSTGAQGRVSADEYNRLLGYGISGLSQGVGKTDVRQVSDKVWDYNRQMAVARAGRSGSTSRTTTAPSGGYPYGGYNLNTSSTYMSDANSVRDIQAARDQFIAPFEHPKTIIASDGKPVVIKSYGDAEQVLDGLGRAAFRQKYNVDPENPHGKTAVFHLDDGRTITGKVVQKSPDKSSSFSQKSFVSAYGVNPAKKDEVTFNIEFEGSHSGVRGGESDLLKQLNEQFRKDYDEYENKVNTFSRNNPDINIRKLAVASTRDRDQYYRAHNIPDDVAWEDAPFYLATRANVGRFSPAVIGGTGEDMDFVRKNYASAMISTFGRAPKGRKDKISKTSDYGFYPVNKQTPWKISDEAIGGNPITKDTDVTEIIAYPEDIVTNRPKIRVGIGNDYYGVNPYMLGDDVGNAVSMLSQDVGIMMLPIMQPGVALNMTPEQAQSWRNFVREYLGTWLPLEVTDENGYVIRDVSPADFVRNPRNQDLLRTAVTAFMNGALANPRDIMNFYHMIKIGNPEKLARFYNNPDNIEQ